MSAAEALPPPALYVKSLGVARGGRTLVSGLDLVLPAGGVLQLKGPNGAGKTSLLLTLAGTLRPAAGSIEYRDRGTKEPLAPNLHLLSAQNAIKSKLSVGENLDFWRAVNGPTGVGSAEALERVGLAGLAGVEAGHLSAGQQRRLAIARLLVGFRPLWLLDEPSAALDSAGEALVRDLIVAQAQRGGIVVVATHHDLALPHRDHSATLTLASGNAVLSR